MAKKQYWTVQTDDGGHDLSYSYAFWTGKSVLCIDGEELVQKLKPFRIGVSRREIFRLGDEQCVLAVSASGRAEIICRGKTVPERSANGGDDPASNREDQEITR